MHWLARIVKSTFNQTFRRKQIDAEIQSLNLTPEELKIVFKHHEFAQIATILADFYQDAGGGPNFVELDAFDPASMRRFRIIVQPSDRPRPAEIIAGMKEALADIATNPAVAKGVALTTLWSFGYDDNGKTPETTK